MTTLVDGLRERLRSRTTGLLGDLGLLDAALNALSKQSRVAAWMRTTFTTAENEDVPERTLRLAEEALELAQAVGVDAETCHRLVDYVFSRPVGKPTQEIAGVMVTLYAAASALNADADTQFEIELARIQTPEVVERCRRRQHEKRVATNGPIGLAAPGGMPKPPTSLDRIDDKRREHRELTPFERSKKQSPSAGVRVGMVFKDRMSIGDAGRRLQVWRIETPVDAEPYAVCRVEIGGAVSETRILCRRLMSNEFVCVLGGG